MVADLIATTSAVGFVQVNTSSTNDDIEFTLTSHPNEGDEEFDRVAVNVIVNRRDSSPWETPSLPDDSPANSILTEALSLEKSSSILTEALSLEKSRSILTEALSLEKSPSIVTEALSMENSIYNEAANGIQHQDHHPPSTPTQHDGIKEQERPPLNPTLDEDEFEIGRDNTDEFEYRRYKLSPSFSQRGLELTTADQVPSWDYNKLAEAERRRLLRKLKKEMNDESMLSSLGIEEDKSFDTASESSEDPSIYSDDGSTAFYTETSTAFDTENSTAFYNETSTAFYNDASQWCKKMGGGRDGKRRASLEGYETNKSMFFYEDEEDYDKQECCLTDVCMSLITGDYKVEVEDVNKETDQRARSNEISWHEGEEQIGKDCNAYSKGSRKSKIEGILEDDSSDISLILGHYNKNEIKQSNQCDRSNDVTWIKVEDGRGAGILVDDVSRGGSNGSQNSKRGLTVKERLLSQEGGRKSDESDSTDVVHRNQRARSYEKNRHNEDEEVGEEIHEDGFGSGDGKGSRAPKSGDISLILSGYKVKVDEENDQSIRRAQNYNNDMSQHKEEEEMEKEIIVNDISSSGSKGTSKLTSELTPKERLLSLLSDKKLDKGNPTAASVTPFVAPASDDELCAISKSRKKEDDSVAVRPCVRECDGVLSVDHENIEVHGSNETDHIGLGINVLGPLAALNIMGMKTKDDLNSKAPKPRLEIPEQSKDMSVESDPLSVATNLAFSASNEVKVDNLMGSLSLNIPLLNQLAALIWNDTEKDLIMDEANLDGIVQVDLDASDVNSTNPNDDGMSQLSRSGMTVKKRLVTLGGSGKNGADPTTVDAHISPVFVTPTGAPALVDLMRATLKSQKDEEEGEEIRENILADDIHIGVVKATPKSKTGLPCKERLLSKRGCKKSDVGDLSAISLVTATAAPALDGVSKDTRKGVWELDHEIIELNSHGLIQGENVTMSKPNSANQEKSSMLKSNDSFFASALKFTRTPKASNKAQIEKKSHHNKATPSSIKVKSLSQITSTKTCESGVNGVTPKKRSWMEYIDTSSGKPYYSNGMITTWDRPANIEISVSSSITPRTPTLSTRRKPASPASTPITPILRNTRAFTVTASTPPRMGEPLPQLKPKQRQAESKANEQNQQPRQHKLFKLSLKQKKTSGIDGQSSKETKNARCSPDRTVSSTDEDPIASIQDTPNHLQKEEKEMILDGHLSKCLYS